MNLQEKLFESAAQLRARAGLIASAALAPRVEVLKKSFAVLQLAGKDLNRVARRHVTRFVNENRTIAVDAGKDVAAVARSTYASLNGRGTARQGAPRKAVVRRRKKVA
jgi:hypothetical protein